MPKKYLTLFPVACLLVLFFSANCQAGPRAYKNGDYAGMSPGNNATAIFKVYRSNLSMLHFGAIETICTDLATGEAYTWPVTVGENETAEFYIRRNGRFRGEFQPPSGTAYDGVTFNVSGRLNGRRGKIYVNFEYRNDVVDCWGPDNEIPVRKSSVPIFP